LHRSRGSTEDRNARERGPVRGETMSPLPGSVNGASRRSEGAKPQESRQPREGPADPSASQGPVTPAGRDVVPLEGWEGRPRDYKRRPGRTGRTLWRGEAQGGSAGGPERVRTPSAPREQSPEGGRRVPKGIRARTSGGQGPLEGCRRARGHASKGEAHGRSGASRAGRVGGGRRDGGDQTPDVARGDGGIRPHDERIRRLEIVS